MRLNAPELVIDLGGIDALRQISDDGDTITIGAMAPYYEILAHDGVRTTLGLLHKAIAEVADPQIRHRGTLGGALVHADPAGDCGAPTLALDAELVVQGSGGERTVAAADFFEDLFATAVGEDELLTAIRFRSTTAGARTTRSSCGSPTSGRSSRWPQRSGRRRRRSARPGSAWSTWAPPRCGPPRPSRRWSGVEATADGIRAACDRPPRAPTRPRTSTATPTTAGTWRTVLTRRAVLAAAGG